MVSNWVYRKSDSVFLRGGFCDFTVDPLTEGLRQFADADQPDLVIHRFDAALGKRLATQAELDAVTAASNDAVAATGVNTNKAIKALAFVLLQRILGRNPTVAERQQLLADVIAVYKTL